MSTSVMSESNTSKRDSPTKRSETGHVHSSEQIESVENDGDINSKTTEKSEQTINPNSKKEKEKEINNSNNKRVLCTGCIAFAVAFFGIASYFTGAHPQDSITSVELSKGAQLRQWENAELIFKRSVIAMKAKYPHQNHETWIELLAAASSTLSSQIPGQPSSVVFLRPPGLNHKFPSCLGRELGKSVHSAFANATGSRLDSTEVLVLGSDYFNNAVDVTSIHQKLKGYLKTGKVVIFTDVHLIRDPEKLMVFHAFCDNTAAPDKRAIYIFVLPVPNEIYQEREWLNVDGVHISNVILNEAWQTINPDKRHATLVRVAPAAVKLNPGDTCE